eukprot:gb/GFBE01058130.1/.p1 GENE.gb/GFBE01058130.1/~~gb/GFBE01058130.1/.p1  ORF type:complete len:248 (+),score=52.41 gb/GFBE01058130.1/:1-744(+)
MRLLAALCGLYLWHKGLPSSYVLPTQRRSLRSARASGTEQETAHCCFVKEEHDEYLVVGNALSGPMMQDLGEYLNELDLEDLVAHFQLDDGDQTEQDEDFGTSDTRESMGAFFDARSCPWLQEHLAQLFCEAGHGKWPLLSLDANGEPIAATFEDAQYCVYGPEHHFDWHCDQPEGCPPPARRLSMVVMLSSADDYSGGEFEVRLAEKVRQVQLDPGDAILFPAEHLEHRVKPVKAGVRQTLVCWAY